MRRPLGATVAVRFALAALALMSFLPAVAGAQDVLCDAGEKEVHAVRFEGNTTFSEDELSARVLTTPSSLTRRYLSKIGIERGGARRCYPDIGLANDIANLRAHYRNNGFYDTLVDTIVTPAAKGAIDVTFRIREGQPLILDSLAITGLDAVPERDRILSDSLLKVGHRAGPILIVSEKDTIESRLRNTGYPHATVFQGWNIHQAEHRTEVELSVQPGARARIGTIAVTRVGISGDSASIDSSVVLRLLGFRPGDLYSDRALNDAQRRLSNLTTYKHVAVTLDTAWVHGDSVADIDVDLREDYLRQFDLEEGWSTLDCLRASAQLSHKNFNGEAGRVDLTTRVSKVGYGEPTRSNFTRENVCYRKLLDQDSLASSQINYYVGFSFRFPTILGSNWVPSYSLYTERRGQFQAYLRTTVIGLSAAFTRDISPNTPLRIGYSFESGSTRAEPAILCALFNRCTLDEQDEVQRQRPLGIASVGLQRATIDNPVAPTRGYVAAVEARYSNKALDVSRDTSLFSFFKLTGDASWYRGLTKRVTFAARARGGFIKGGQEAGGARLPPPQERLYAGGPTSVRGFGDNQLGPQVYLLDRAALDSTFLTDSTFIYVAKSDARPQRPIPGGGNLFTVLNAELRIRDPFFPELLEYVPFVDAGQVWISDVSKPKLNRTPLAVTPGLSFRYYSPFGPIQANLGYNRYPPRPGAAYFVTSSSQQTNRPLICVTAPGAAPLVITRRDGELVQDVQACPASFVPFQSSNFFSRIKFSLSINSDF